MAQSIKETITKYLSQSRKKGKNTKFPPSGEEIEGLISYLKTKGLDPIIVGSLAVVRHLKLTSVDIEKNLFPPTEEVNFLLQSHNNSFRPTQDIDLFVSKSLPQPPSGWKPDRKSLGVSSWISPTGGYVDFLIAGHQFPDGPTTLKQVNKDPESNNTGWPIADLVSIFLLKLNSFREKDLFDLVVLAHKVGIPSSLLSSKLNETQSENLQTVKMWLEHGGLLK